MSNETIDTTTAAPGTTDNDFEAPTAAGSTEPITAQETEPMTADTNSAQVTAETDGIQAPAAEDAAVEPAADTPAPAADTNGSDAPATEHKGKGNKKNRNKGKPSEPAAWRVRQCADARWEPFKQAAANNTSFEVQLMAVAEQKGPDGKPLRTFGFNCMTSNGLEAFLPQCEMPRGVKQKEVLHRKLAVKVERLELDPTKGGPALIVSRNKAVKDEQKDFIASLQAGASIPGKTVVVAVQDGGYFVTVHGAGPSAPTAKAWLSKQQAKGELKERQKVDGLRVLSNKDGKISLTMLTEEDEAQRANLHREFADSLQPGVTVSSKVVVTGEHEHGYFVRVFSDNPAVSPVRAWVPKRHSNEALAVDQVLEGARVLTRDGGKISLTLLSEAELEERTRQYERRQAQRAQRENRGEGDHQQRPKRADNRHQPERSTQRNGGAATAVKPTAPAAHDAPAKAPKKQPRPASKPKNLAKGDGIVATSFADFGALWQQRFAEPAAADSKPADTASEPAGEAAPEAAPEAPVSE